jgi:hypothetical protein
MLVVLAKVAVMVMMMTVVTIYRRAPRPATSAA